MRRYYAFLALLGALALAALVGLFFLIKAAAGWARDVYKRQTRGIRDVSVKDIALAARQGAAVRLIAWARTRRWRRW